MKTITESKLNQLFKSVKTDEVKAEDISKVFMKARQMLADGSFPNLKKIVELYVQKIVVYEDRADVYLNFQPHLRYCLTIFTEVKLTETIYRSKKKSTYVLKTG